MFSGSKRTRSDSVSLRQKRVQTERPSLFNRFKRFFFGSPQEESSEPAQPDAQVMNESIHLSRDFTTDAHISLDRKEENDFLAMESSRIEPSRIEPRELSMHRFHPRYNPAPNRASSVQPRNNQILSVINDSNPSADAPNLTSNLSTNFTNNSIGNISANGPNETLRQFFESKGEDPLSNIEVVGVLNLIGQAVGMNESVVDFSRFSDMQTTDISKLDNTEILAREIPPKRALVPKPALQRRLRTMPANQSVEPVDSSANNSFSGRTENKLILDAAYDLTPYPDTLANSVILQTMHEQRQQSLRTEKRNPRIERLESELNKVHAQIRALENAEKVQGPNPEQLATKPSNPVPQPSKPKPEIELVDNNTTDTPKPIMLEPTPKYVFDEIIATCDKTLAAGEESEIQKRRAKYVF